MCTGTCSVTSMRGTGRKLMRARMVKLLPKVVKVNLKMQVCCFAVVNALTSSARVTEGVPINNTL